TPPLSGMFRGCHTTVHHPDPGGSRGAVFVTLFNGPASSYRPSRGAGLALSGAPLTWRKLRGAPGTSQTGGAKNAPTSGYGDNQDHHSSGGRVPLVMRGVAMAPFSGTSGALVDPVEELAVGPSCAAIWRNMAL
ncbi:MAG: hypothetical protein QOF99_2542, partial [Pseudonocardiales bacterium]|nr:hypothetical protein [Pseudonocardiales bacterium]